MQDFLNALADSFYRYWTETVQPELAPTISKVLVIGVILLITWFVSDRLRSLATHASTLSRADENTMLLIGRIVQIAVLVVGLILALTVVGIQIAGILTVVGAVSIAISFAIQDVLKNFVAGLYLLVERPFRIGQEITVKENVGKVVTVGIRTTVLKTEDNVQIVVPNAIIFSEIIVNGDAYGGRKPAEPPPATAEPEPDHTP